MDYLLMSDIHLNNWSKFSSFDSEGVSERLKITESEIRRALDRHASIGGQKRLVIAGDTFHTRGRVETIVMNTAIKLFSDISKQWDVDILTGNHDLQSSESRELTSAVSALKALSVNVHSSVNENNGIVFCPWVEKVSDLQATLEDLAKATKQKSKKDLIIHAPVDDVIAGLPNNGITADFLLTLGFKRVFSGHYHNHKELIKDKVYSIGALTHQTFSDVGSKAGFLSVFDDGVIYHASNAPNFIEIDNENFDDAELLVDGNYVRCKVNVKKESEVSKLRDKFVKWGALGVQINYVNESQSERKESIAANSLSIEKSIVEFIRINGYSDEVKEDALDIFAESLSIGDEE